MTMTAQIPAKSPKYQKQHQSQNMICTNNENSLLCVQETTSIVWQVRRTGAPLFWLLTFYTLNGPNNDFMFIWKNANSVTIIVQTNIEIPPLCSMENDIKCVTGQENWCSSLLIAGLLHAQWAERTVMTWFNLTTATIHINGLSPNFLLTHHYEFKAFLKVNSSSHNSYNLSKACYCGKKSTNNLELPDILKQIY